MVSQDPWQRIYTSALKFLVPLEVKENYRVIAKEALELVGGGYASIFLFEGSKLKRVHTTLKELSGIEPRKHGVTYEVFRTRVPQLRYKDSLVVANEKFENLPVQSNIIIPLNYGHISLGVLSVLSKEKKTFNDDDLKILTLFAPLATLAIRKTRLLEETNKALKTRNLFILLAEHEIKNPLTSIMLNLDLLKKSKSMKVIKQKKYIEKLEEITGRLVTIVNDFLQSEQKTFMELKYVFTTVNFLSLCKEVTIDLSKQNRTHRFLFRNLTLEKKVLVECDINKIRQVLTNLINNSLKFSSPGTTVEIIVRIVKGKVNVSVSDTGLGISKEDLPKVFRRYYSGRVRERGMGLGLYLVKKIIVKHKGSVNIKSKVGKGTIVSFSLPIYESRI